MFNLCLYTAPRFDPLGAPSEDSGAAPATAAPAAPPAPPALDLSSMLPQTPSTGAADLTQGDVSTTGTSDGQNSAGQPAQTLDINDARQAPVQAAAENNSETAAQAAAAIVEAAAAAPEATAFVVPTDAIRNTVANFDFFGSELMPQVTELMGGDQTLATSFASLINTVLRNAVADGMVFSAELNQRHSTHLMGQQQALTQDQQLRAAITERMPEGATAIQVNGAIATARGLQSTNPTLPVAQIAEVAAQLIAAPQTGQAQGTTLDYSNSGDTATQYADMRKAFGLTT